MSLPNPKTLIAICVVAMTPMSLCADPDAAPSVDVEQFRVLEGEGWEGGLNYLDYGSDKRITIPVTMEIEIVSDRALEYEVQYPDEPQYNSKEKLKISREGTEIDGYEIIAVESDSDGVLTITSEGTGKDDGKKASIQKVYVISAKEFRIQKNVRFADESDWLNRNEYHLER